MLFGLFVFAAIVVTVFVLATTYNSVVAAAERASRSWNNLDALLRQRHDEIPKVIEFFEPHLRGERAAFDKLLAMRDAIFAARQTRAADALGAAESGLRADLAALIARAARDPGLAANPAFALLRQRNATLDAEIAERRALYDEAVSGYNVAIGRLPGNVVALLGGFRPLRALGADATGG
jgi:LemA protein